jgi:hypothetical protein
MKYVQCELRRQIVWGESTSTIVRWLPEKFAVVGAIVRVRKNSHAPWSERVEVFRTFGEQTEEETAKRTPFQEWDRIVNSK